MKPFRQLSDLHLVSLTLRQSVLKRCHSYPVHTGEWNTRWDICMEDVETVLKDSVYVMGATFSFSFS
jgi:hypothetical protein